ncbi:MAG: hypothetical protein EOM34_09175 [Clostridia bacterium]|nr:hypothetical protein [Lachnospiraceae bacterium]NCC00837.1 hypothetical protein [Clostridia bacterium]NCD02067.1 hypothetical protein [Clostridia bacterium]
MMFETLGWKYRLDEQGLKLRESVEAGGLAESLEETIKTLNFLKEKYTLEEKWIEKINFLIEKIREEALGHKEDLTIESTDEYIIAFFNLMDEMRVWVAL